MNILAIDTNIIISAMIKDGLIRNLLTNFKCQFLFPEYGLGEIYSYKKEIMDKARINDIEFNTLLLRLLKYIRLVPLNIIINFRDEADNIIGPIHKEDAVFIATALAFNCPIWSDDKHFKKQHTVKVFNTKEIKGLFEET